MAYKTLPDNFFDDHFPQNVFNILSPSRQFNKKKKNTKKKIIALFKEIKNNFIEMLEKKIALKSDRKIRPFFCPRI